MDKGNVASKIKTLRKRSGFSQEKLAEESALSLRTVQRIENGETIPHGDTLRKLTQALGVTPEEFFEVVPIENNGYLAVMNLSALAFLLHPLLGIILPMILWILKKDQQKSIDDSGRVLMSFQLFWTLVLYALQFLVTKGTFVRFDLSFLDVVRALFAELSILGLSVTFLYLYNIVLILVNARWGQRGYKAVYRPFVTFNRLKE